MNKIILVLLRLGLGFIFLWAFFDKLFGLGFATAPERAWIRGGSPTYGFLTNAPQGPFAFFFKSLAGNPIIDWIFMIGLLSVGISLLTNYLIKLGAVAGIIMLVLMYLAVLPPENNPIIDDHMIYALILAYIGFQKKEVVLVKQ